VRLVVEIVRSSDGRLEGRARPDGSQVSTAFSGVLELLKVLEDLVARPRVGPLATDHVHDSPAHIPDSTKGVP
jgi:hypothetical protein